ncbi:MAG: hypothetical protein KAQ85_10210, partial [Thermodesulfovibrionia bacterium]|nr:hypothetical protein [Thermodesulfovibrionia bacterium]
KNVQHDKNAPVVGLQFKDAKRSRTSPYINALSRGGFNGRDLGIKALKILGVITFMANVANSVKTAQGKDIFEKAANAVGSIATNPGVYIGAAVAGGTHMIEMHPRYLEYPFASAHERMDINAGVKLGRIKKHVGANAMSTFIQRGNPIDNNSPLSKEWLVMDKISDRKIKKLVDKAKKKPHPRLGPVIANKDIEKSIPKNQRHVVLAGLSRSSMNARARFLFYEKFLYGKKPNIQQLRNVCTD